MLIYDSILEGVEESEAIDYLKQYDWSECEATEQEIGYKRFIDNYQGVSCYYDYGADYYFFILVKQVRQIVRYYDLPAAWLLEARSNTGDYEDAYFLAPLEDEIAGEHALWDLESCMRAEGEGYNGVITVSNNTAMFLNISEDGETAEVWII